MFQNNNHHGVSILVSDDESDELGRMRVRARRKRKKLGHKRLLRKLLLKYWMLLIIIPAACLLFYEATRIGLVPQSRTHVDGSTPTLVKQSHPNLDRLDPTTHVVAGVRERKFIFNFVEFILI